MTKCHLHRTTGKVLQLDLKTNFLLWSTKNTTASAPMTNETSFDAVINIFPILQLAIGRYCERVGGNSRLATVERTKVRVLFVAVVSSWRRFA